QTYLAQKITRYLSKQFNTNIYVGGVNVALFSKVILKEVWIEDQNADTLLFAEKVSATLDTLSFSRRYISLSRLSCENTKINVKQNTKGVFNFSFFGRTPKKEIPPNEKWSFNCNRFIINKSAVNYHSLGEKPVTLGIDELRMRIDQFHYSPDSLGFRLFSMSLLESSGFYLNEMSANFKLAGKNFYIDDLRLETLKSAVENANFAYTQEELPGTEELYSNIKLELNKSTVNLADAAVFFPQIEGMDQEFYVSGIFSGNSDYIRAKNLDITTGDNTRLYCDVSLNYLSDSAEPFIFVDLKQAQTDFNDLSRINLPISSQNRNISFPPAVYNSGIISYQGSFAGFPTDFVAYGTLKSQMGQVKTDLSIVPGAKDIIRYNGKIETENFNIGHLVQSDLVGDVTLNGLVNGVFDQKRGSFNGEFDGLISKLFLNYYDYSNISLNGNFINRKFDGNMAIDDPNLQLSFVGEFDFNKQIPVFDFSLELEKADFVALKIDTVNSVSDLTLDLNANFSGYSLDNIDGSIHLTNGQYTNQNGELNCESFKINTHIDEYISHASIVSDFFDLSIDGIYHFATLFDSFGSVFTKYLPSLAGKENNFLFNNLFDMTLEVKNLDEITQVFIPSLAIETPFSMYCDLDSYEGTIKVEGKIPGFTWNGLDVRNTDINITPYTDKLNLKIRLDELSFGKNFALKNLGLFIDAANDNMNTRLIWGNSDALSYHGNIESVLHLFKRESGGFPLLNAEILDSEIMIADSLWRLAPSSVTIDSTAVAIKNFLFSNSNQAFTMNGKISEQNDDELRLTMQGVGLSSFDHYLQRQIGLEGVVNGHLSISDFYAARRIGADINVADFRFTKQDIGDVQISSGWNNNTQKIDASLKILKDGVTSLDGNGFVDPTSRELRFDVGLDHLPISMLGLAIKNVFSDFSGQGSGRVVISGALNNIQLDGAVFAEKAGLKIDYTQVPYQLNDSIRFSGNSIIFNNIRTTDPDGNFAFLNGTIKHTGLKNMVYDLSVQTPQIQALNTTFSDNNAFYGKAFASGDIKITGVANNMKMDGTATTLPGTSFTIVLSNDSEVTKYDFVRFVSEETGGSEGVVRQSASPKDTPGSFEMDVVINVTPDASAQMIYNTQISDVIKGQGDGALRFRLDKDNNIFLYGSINITQ
ncbi:MAG: translocation/assembly module TamB, partial [Prolixibacteraceae bacterium]|nr:translocation/assembly module TamB [Prolixibacteraceae bacterium]